MAEGDPRAEKVYDTVGTYLGYSVAHYADHYDLRHVLVTGRVTTGAGGERLLMRAREVLWRPNSQRFRPERASAWRTRRTSAMAKRSPPQAFPLSVQAPGINIRLPSAL